MLPNKETGPAADRPREKIARIDQSERGVSNADHAAGQVLRFPPRRLSTQARAWAYAHAATAGDVARTGATTMWLTLLEMDHEGKEIERLGAIINELAEYRDALVLMANHYAERTAQERRCST